MYSIIFDPKAAEQTCLDQFHRLSEYTLTHRGSEFLHQLAVDAYAVSHATENPKTRKLPTASGRIGLYCACELGYTGKQAQKVHMFLGNKMKFLPEFEPPKQKPELNVTNVLTAPVGKIRDNAIPKWAEAVWAAWQVHHAAVENRLLTDFPLEIRTKALGLKNNG